MHLLCCNDYYLIQASFGLLKCSRKDASLTTHPSDSPLLTAELSCLGQIHGIVGKLPGRTPGQSSVLLVIAEWTQVGLHPFRPQQYGAVYRIDRVVAVPLCSAGGGGESPSLNRPSSRELQLPKCVQHEQQLLPAAVEPIRVPSAGKLSQLGQSGQRKLKSTFTSLLGASNAAPPPQSTPTADENAQPAPPPPSSPRKATTRRDESPSRDRVLDDVLDMFNAQRAFYVCQAGDLTCSLLRWVEKTSEAGFDPNTDSGSVKFVDQRFFWNRHALDDLLQQEQWNLSGDSKDAAANAELQLSEQTCAWIMPIIQGFYRQIILEFKLHNGMSVPVKLSLLSRRNVHRAGTRYIKRGIDDRANCANFVETEQTIEVSGHCLSFSLVRASVPLYWSQRGYKYRPPPTIDRPLEHSLPIYAQHVDSLVERYGAPLVMINLVNQEGREKQLGESFLQHVLEMDSDQVTYIAFDYHEHCRGMRIDRIQTLIMASMEQCRQIGFTWLDDRGLPICKQQGVFRVNCVDCLDRTNVAQAALAHAALELMLNKLGILSPRDEADSATLLGAVPHNVLQALNHVWADNGDCISMQYAGTAALKGDVTRSTQRTWTGMLKDGYNSASRYYLCHVRDAQKQAAIDCFLGIKTSIDKPLTQEQTNAEAAQVHEELRYLVQECERFFLPASEYAQLLGAWAMVDADSTKDALLQLDIDMNTVLMLTRRAFYVCQYDDEADKFSECHRVSLHDIVAMQCAPLHAANTVSSLLSSVSKEATGKEKEQRSMTCLRIFYKNTQNMLADSAGNSKARRQPYFYTLRPASTRLFNNMALALKSRDEADEYTAAIAEQFIVASQVCGVTPPLQLEPVAKLERLKPRSVGGSRSGSSALNARLGSALTFFSSAGNNLKQNLNSLGSRSRLASARGGEPDDDEQVLIVTSQADVMPNSWACIVSSEAGLLFHRPVVSDFIESADISCGHVVCRVRFLDDHGSQQQPQQQAAAVPSSGVRIQLGDDDRPQDGGIPTALRVRSPIIDFAANASSRPMTPNASSSMLAPPSAGLKPCSSDSQLLRVFGQQGGSSPSASAQASPSASPPKQQQQQKTAFLSNLSRGFDRTTSSLVNRVYATGSQVASRTLRAGSGASGAQEEMANRKRHVFSAHMPRIEMSRSTFVLL